MSATHSPNKLHRMVAKTEALPAFVREQLLTLAFGRLISYARTSGVRVESLSESQAVVSIANAKHVRNHIGGLHAVAMAVVVESATGYLVGMNVPDTGVPVIKTMTIHYTRRAQGGLRAVASLTPEQIAMIRTEPKGEVQVSVTVTDESGREPITCEMTWAWTPKKRG